MPTKVSIDQDGDCVKRTLMEKAQNPGRRLEAWLTVPSVSVMVTSTLCAPPGIDRLTRGFSDREMEPVISALDAEKLDWKGYGFTLSADMEDQAAKISKDAKISEVGKHRRGGVKGDSPTDY